MREGGLQLKVSRRVRFLFGNVARGLGIAIVRSVFFVFYVCCCLEKANCITAPFVIGAISKYLNCEFLAVFKHSKAKFW